MHSHQKSGLRGVICQRCSLRFWGVAELNWVKDQSGWVHLAGKPVSILISQSPITRIILCFKILSFPLQSQRKLLFQASENFLSSFREINSLDIQKGMTFFLCLIILGILNMTSVFKVA